MNKREIKFHKKYEAVFQSGKAPVDQLADGFDVVLSRILVESEWEMDLLRAMGDKGGLVKEQIKHSTLQHVVEVFGECYLRATGNSWVRDANHMLKEDENE